MAEILKTSMCDDVHVKDTVPDQNKKKKRNSTWVNKDHHQHS